MELRRSPTWRAARALAGHVPGALPLLRRLRGRAPEPEAPDPIVTPPQRLDRKQVAREFVVEDASAGDVPLLERKWYYSIEVEPGIFTSGRMFPNVHLTRSALRQIDVAGLNCLDIGTMEGLTPLLLKRRGAGHVVAYDRLQFPERIEFLKEKLSVDFDYIAGLPLRDLRGRLGGETFDLVVFSGVLYHMLDPLAGLFTARSFVKTGGIVVVETAAVLAPTMASHFNAGGRFLPGDNFWLISVRLLDYLLRFARLQPLDCFYFEMDPPKAFYSDLPLCRICIPCLAVHSAPSREDDNWIKTQQPKDVSEFLDWSKIGRREPLPYTLAGHTPVKGADGAVDAWETVCIQEPTMPTDPDSQLRLRLDAIY